MLPKLILLASLGFSWWLIKRDVARREGLSSAIWIPTIWAAIIGSRPVSEWLGFGGGSTTMEGSPVDGFIFFALIFAAFGVLARRGLNWSAVICENWPILLFYAFLWVSLFWANSYFISFKRWGKEFGNIAVLLVILTEARPREAVRAVFVRCAYLWLPLSLVLIRYFPSIGRFYSLNGGEGEMTGVTTQKNSLGELVLVCGLVLLWDWLEFRKANLPSKAKRLENRIYLAFLVLAAYLMHLCNSATSLVSLLVGASIIVATRLPLFRRRPDLLGVAALAFFVSFWVLDKTVGVKEDVVGGLGRDMTYTHRTEIWGELLDLHTDPIFGVGFMSFWDDERYQSRLPYWARHTSAHSGYLEEYLGGGWVGIFFVIVMLLGTGFRINSALRYDGDYGAARLAVFVAFLMHNFAESNIACMTLFGFIFLLTGIGHAQSAYQSNMLTEDASGGDDCHLIGEEAEPAAVLTYDSY